MFKWIILIMTLIATPLEAKTMTTKAATYVLVHGAWGGGDAYDGTAKALKAAGHSVQEGNHPRDHADHPRG
jgi:hypothetical protein